MMRNTFKFIISAATLLASASFSAIADENVNKFGTDSKISDLALIYAGNSTRPDWTQDDLRPYVTHVYADGHEDWFFDGFLFLEFANGKIQFQNGSGLEPAKQADWLWLLDQFFAPGKKLDALDKLITQKKNSLGQPPLRHKVVLACCAPSKSKNGNWSARVSWGEVNGKKLYFSLSDDRVTAVKWYIDTMLEKWQAAGFENIDLEGIYWLEEGLFSNGTIMAEINDYVHSKGLRSYWIPYYLDNKTYWSQWKDTYNFDTCYLQPNYAFYDKNGNERPYSLLSEAVAAAKSYGMGLEFEFETQGTSNALHSVNPTLHQHINDYMDVFDSEGVFNDAGVAYYTGTQGLIHMDKSYDPVDHATIDRLARYVAKRQKDRVQSAGAEEAVSDNGPIAYSHDGRIYLSSDSCCHDISGRLVYQGGGPVDCRPGLYIINDMRGHTQKLLVK